MSRTSARPTSLILSLVALVLLVLASLPGGASGAPLPKFTQVSASGTATAGDLRQVIASCDAGSHVTGGGYEIQSINPAIFVHQDVPLGPEVNDGRWGWAVTLLNETGVDVVFSVVALCAKD